MLRFYSSLVVGGGLFFVVIIGIVFDLTTSFIIPTSSSSSSQQQQQQRGVWRMGTSLSSSTTNTNTPPTPPMTLDGMELRGPMTPLGNFVLVKTKETLSATDGGIILPDESKERPTEGEVLAAGPGKLHPHTGIRIHNPVSTGMNVLYGEFAGSAISVNGEDAQMIRDDDIMLYYNNANNDGKSMKFMTEENVTPCRDYVLIRLTEQQLETSSGIVVAATVTKDDAPCEGIVFKVGEGRLCSKGLFTPSPVEVGDRVKFKDYAGNLISIEGKAFALVRMVDILCSMNEDKNN